MLAKVLLVVLVGVACADRHPPPSYTPPRPSYSPPTPSYRPSRPSYHEPQSGPAQYDFDWAVNDQNSGNDFGHQESRDGYNTEGSYYVALPDGRLQRVTYYVNGDSGYVAQVEYEGEAQYPNTQSYQPRPQPSYQRPRPSYN